MEKAAVEASPELRCSVWFTAWPERPRKAGSGSKAPNASPISMPVSYSKMEYHYRTKATLNSSPPEMTQSKREGSGCALARSAAKIKVSETLESDSHQGI